MRIGLTISFAVILVACTYLFLRPNQPTIDPEYADAYHRLLDDQKKADPSSDEGRAIAEKIRLIEKRMGQHPKADQPDEFARIMYEMRIPYGETAPSYPANYRLKELDKARAMVTGMTVPLPWVERGPGNVAGRVRGLVVDPDDASGHTWFIGSVGGGIWKTTNAGQHWTELAPALPNLAVSTIAMAQSNHDILYAGTGESMFSVDVVNGDGMLKSTDHGATWFQLAATVANDNFGNISRIIVDPSNADIVLASTTVSRYKLAFLNRSGIFKSTNGGLSWTEVYNETDIGGLGRVKKILQIIDTPGNFNVLFAGIDEKGVLKSTDAGDSWFVANTGITDVSGRFELAVSPSNPNRVYAAAEGASTSNLFVSTDAGTTWRLTTTSGTSYNWLSSQGWYDNTIVVHLHNENVVYVGGVNLYQITMIAPTQKTMTPLSTGSVHVDHHNLVIIPGAGQSFRILNSNDGGIGLSGDSSVNWTKPTDGLNTSQFYGIDKKPGASAYVGGMQDNGTWRSPENSDAVSPWTFQIGGDGYETSWHFNDPLKIIGGSQYNGLRRSLDGGLSFTSATSGLTNTSSSNAPFITKIAKTNAEPDLLFAVGASGVFRSTNFGANWTLTSITGTNWGSISSFADVEISKANPDVVWAGMRMDATGKINVSTNRGLTFQPTPLYSLTGMGGISGMATHPYEDSTAYILFSFAHKPKILRTTDLGQTWDDISGFGADTLSNNGFPDVAVYDLLVMPNNPNVLWAGTEIGLFESTNNGTSWHIANNGLPAVCVWDIVQVENEVVIGSHGRGIWSVTIPGLAGDQIFSPLITNAYQNTHGNLAISVNLRSLYDSAYINIEGNRFHTFGPNATAPFDTTLMYPVIQADTVLITLTAFKNGVPYNAVSKSQTVIVLNAAQASFVSNFDGGTAPILGNSYSIATPSGFNNPGIHSAHSYSNNLNITCTLTVPIIVDSATGYLAYDDIALVEPGEPGTVWGDAEFWDYVVVEGTRDGVNWINFEDGYDCRWDPDWLNAYNTSTPGNATMFRHHEVDMRSAFNHGEQILIRFRLYADEAVTGWGWAIDNLEIQDRITVGVDSDVSGPRLFALDQNFPNPFNPTTTIKFSIDQDGPVTLKIYNVLGQEVATVVRRQLKAGSHVIQWNGRNSSGHVAGSGLYIYKLTSGGKTLVRKMMMMK